MFCISDYASIITECNRRNYTQPETLAVLTLAIDEQWASIPAGFFNQLDAIPHPTPDPWYNIAALHGLSATQWQTYKNRLYTHINEAVLYLQPGEDDLLSALTPAQQLQLVTDIAAIREDVAQIRAQLGPSLPSWPSLGKNAAGQELTLRDAFGVMKTDVAAIKKKAGA